MDKTRNNQTKEKFHFQSMNPNQKNKIEINHNNDKFETSTDKEFNIKAYNDSASTSRKISQGMTKPYLFIQESNNSKYSPTSNNFEENDDNKITKKEKGNHYLITTINKRLVDLGFFEIKYTKSQNLEKDLKIIFDFSSLFSVLSALLNEIEKERFSSTKKIETNSILETDQLKEKENEIKNLKLTIESQKKDLTMMQDLLGRAEVHIQSIVSKEQTIVDLSNKLKLAQNMLNEKDEMVQHLLRDGKEYPSSLLLVNPNLKENLLYNSINEYPYENTIKELHNIEMETD